MAYCGDCIHLNVCKTAESCCGSVPRCKHFWSKKPGTPAQQLRAMAASRAQQLRLMTDEQLADILYELFYGMEDVAMLFCDGKANCITQDGDIQCSEERKKKCILRWLQER